MHRGLFALALAATLFVFCMPDLAHADPIVFPYTAIQLTEQVNRIPNLFGLLNALNVFPSQGITSTLIEIRRTDGVLNVLPARERGGPASVARRKIGDTLYLEVPHFPHDDFIVPQDLQNMLGANRQVRTLEVEMAERLLAIRNKHAITREWLRMGALRGEITDGDGNVLYNLFNAFDVNKKVIVFDLDDDNFDIDEACNELYQYMAGALRGEVMNGVEILVASDFFSKFRSHPKVIRWFLNQPAALRMIDQDRVQSGGQYGRVFEYGNLYWREYLGIAPLVLAGVETSAPFVPTGKGYARPLGTLSTFRTYDAPANDMRYVNTPGREIYISPKVKDHGEGVELKSQSNPLAICRRPELLVEVQLA